MLLLPVMDNIVVNPPTVANLSGRSRRASKALGLSLIALHLCLTLQVTGRQDQFMLNGLFWLAIAAGLEQPHAAANSSISSSTEQSNGSGDRWRDLGRWAGGLLLAGLALLGGILPALTGQGAWVRLLPGLGFLGWSWVTVGWGWGWSHYRAEWALVLTMMLPQGRLSAALEPWLGKPLVQGLAKAVHFGLHYWGIPTTRLGAELTLPQGAVVVEYGCAGVPLLILLLQLLVIFGYRTALCRRQWLLLGGGTLGIFGLGVTGRIALMAWVVDRPAAFDYWHGSSGAAWFSTGAIALVFGLYQALLLYETRQG